MGRQDGSKGKVSAAQVFTLQPFRHGFNSGFSGSPFLPDELFTGQWDQIRYERGWIFGRLCKREGLAFKPLGKSTPKALVSRLDLAAIRKEII